MQSVYLICGVPASGKSWVCRQLMDKFAYVPHDQYYNSHVSIVSMTANLSGKPVITECPFAERETKEALEKNGIKVIPLFVIESPEVINARYQKRENKPLPKNTLTRASTILNRAVEWKAIHGTSQQILTKLKELPL
jgi:gluconate kinase